MVLESNAMEYMATKGVWELFSVVPQDLSLCSVGNLMFTKEIVNTEMCQQMIIFTFGKSLIWWRRLRNLCYSLKTYKQKKSDYEL